ncbi:MAG TPA: hypothetical protein VGR87_14100 [Candidatus Limnocylindria bacterium]|nr:hypothetical protein [Candidatus Limnocylindria bacterium]
MRFAHETATPVHDHKSWGEPPHDIHSQQGIGGPAYELACFGRNPMLAVRNYFGPERARSGRSCRRT